MELLQLKYFCHAAETQNFSKTAKEFTVPPSNISQCIKRLEEELGATLFSRIGNRVVLNPRGQMFYQDAREALNLLEQAQQNVSSASDGGTIRVGIVLMRRKVRDIIHQFREMFPEVNVMATRLSPDFDPEGFDIVITDGSLASDSFVPKPVVRKKILLTAIKGFLPEGPVSVDTLREVNFISQPPDSIMYKNTLWVCRDLGFEPKILAQEEYSHYYVPRCVEQGMGVALIPAGTVWVRFVEEIMELKDVGEYYREVYVYRKKHRHRSQTLDQFYNYLVQEMEKF